MESKATDGNSNPEPNHSVHEPIAVQANPGDVKSKVRIQWPRANQHAAWKQLDEELAATLSMRLKGPIAKQLSAFSETCHTMCLDKFGEEQKRNKKDVIQQPNRRQLRKGELRRNQRLLKRRITEAPEEEQRALQTLLDDIRQQILTLSKAENHRKRRKKKRKTRQDFFKNPYAFAKKLFTEARSGTLDVPQEELQDHLRKTYSDPLKETPLSEIAGLPVLEAPGTPFNLGGVRSKEVGDFVRKARAASAPGINGISYKLYKNCPSVLLILTGLLQRAWREGVVPEEWCLADGVWIPKEQNSVGTGSFRPISLLNVEGKIFFGVFAKRLTTFLLANGYIDTSVQKAGIPGFPGCLEHGQMIWNSLMTAKRLKQDLHVVWLDLANAYGSVPHLLIKLALEMFHVPVKLSDMLMKYFSGVFMRFKTSSYVTDWQALETGIMMGCVISPLLFVMCMEIMLRAATDTARGEVTQNGLVLPPSKAFMDDITALIPSQVSAQELMDRFHELFTWARMKAKPKKSRSASIVRGKLQEIHFTIGGDQIPTIRENPVKSLGRLYAVPLTDKHRGREIEKTAVEGLASIEKTCLPGKLKAWCFQHGLLPRLLWPLQVYEVALSRVETIQKHISKNLRKWLGVPPCFSTVGLYSKTAALQLPLSSLEEEFKVGKARLHLMLRDSPDEVIRQVNPEVRTGTKWFAARAVEEAESNLKIKDIIGATQTGRQGLGTTAHRWFSRASTTERRVMVTEEVRAFEEEKRIAIAAGQAKQCAWTNWNDVEPRKISWSQMISIEPLALSFLLRSTFDLLPTPVNTKQWALQQNDKCRLCKDHRGTLRHILSGCKKALQMYTWRHNEVLKVLREVSDEQCEIANKIKSPRVVPAISFCREGAAQSSTVPQKLNSRLLSGANDWKVSADLGSMLIFPQHIVYTLSRPDIVLWSDNVKKVVLVELTVPWEENIEEAYERKKAKYESLRAECEDRGWSSVVLPVEVGCRGFVGRSTTKFLSLLGVSGRKKKTIIARLQQTAEKSSCWIWSKAKIRQENDEMDDD